MATKQAALQSQTALSDEQWAEITQVFHALDRDRTGALSGKVRTTHICLVLSCLVLCCVCEIVVGCPPIHPRAVIPLYPNPPQPSPPHTRTHSHTQQKQPAQQWRRRNYEILSRLLRLWPERIDGADALQAFVERFRSRGMCVRPLC